MQARNILLALSRAEDMASAGLTSILSIMHIMVAAVHPRRKPSISILDNIVSARDTGKCC